MRKKPCRPAGRRKVFGTAERPRLSVYRSLKHLQVQLIDDLKGQTLLSVSTLEAGKYGGNISAAKGLGAVLAEQAKKAGIKKVVFDKGPFLYHGRIQALADAAREGGLEF